MFLLCFFCSLGDRTEAANFFLPCMGLELELLWLGCWGEGLLFLLSSFFFLLCFSACPLFLFSLLYSPHGCSFHASQAAQTDRQQFYLGQAVEAKFNDQCLNASIVRASEKR